MKERKKRGRPRSETPLEIVEIYNPEGPPFSAVMERVAPLLDSKMREMLESGTLVMVDGMIVPAGGDETHD